jgi:hypothetical protein
MTQEQRMFTPKQADAVTAALLMRAARNSKPVSHCPSCGAKSISHKAREKLFPFFGIQCPKCQVSLRLRWGRSLLLGFIAVLLLIAVAGLVRIPGFHNLPAALVIILDVCLVASFHAIKRRLPLVAKP